MHKKLWNFINNNNMEHEGELKKRDREFDSDNKFNWCAWNNPQRIGKGTEDLEIRE